ncbi:hypothetical protein Lepto7375DRAFT_2209 [Leptolyngbya sp. PCC 7375]|nr:hypothetical protein Lepto7375DRAFT_2209 [Leptolyngbya sp. PCC 7375]
MSALAIVEAFQELPAPRRGAGRRHHQALCIALFTLAVSKRRYCSGSYIVKWLAKVYQGQKVFQI